MQKMPKQLSEVEFENRFVQAFPGDPSPVNRPRQVRGALYSLVDPTPVDRPRVVAWSDEAGRLLGVDRPPAEGPVAELLGGNRLLPGMKPFASCYGGHQFGGWAGQLGDGRALSLGEVAGWEVQLKGAGPTPYSRRGDGRAVLRSSVREFLCSEIMHFLDVPTTRALSLVSTGEEVVRDMFYDGRAAPEPGAICTRISPSFLRFGHFEMLAQREETKLLRDLADFVVQEYFPEFGPPGPKAVGLWFEELCRRTALLMVDWLRVGFVHGVMNTDNMSVLGITIDYGPYGWLDVYDPAFTPNTTDRGGRYAYGRQPRAALWNLERLAVALVPLVEATERLEKGLGTYLTTFAEEQRRMLLARLGLPGGDEPLLQELLALLQTTETDMTLFFRRLADVPLEARAEGDLLEPLQEAYYGQPDEAHRERLVVWLRQYASQAARQGVDPDTRRERMNRVNPRIIPRNYLVHQVIEQAERGDYQGLDIMLGAFRHPYDAGSPEDPFEHRRPEWARHAPGCSALSCSS